jgi:hypothetical protein
MVWPVARGERPERKSTLPPPPAPERMQTEPDVRQPAPAPAPKPPAAAPAAPDPAPPARPADPAGSNANLDDGAHDVAPMPNPLTPQALPPSLHGLVPGDPSDDKMLELQRIGQILGHVCRKMLRCGGVDDDTKDLCDAMVNADPPRPCPSADRCFARIDAMACGKPLFQLRQLDALLTQFPDCAAATRC